MKQDNQSVCRFAHFAMGTTFELLISGRVETYARQASQAVFSEVDRIENLFSRFNPCSEISQVNRLVPGQSLMVGVEVFECLKIAAWVMSQTHGAFDINIASLLKSKKEISTELQKMKTEANILKQIDLIQTQRGYMIRIPDSEGKAERSQLNLDLGGIGKGYALDKTLDILSDWSISDALIHGGTSTALALGSPAGGSSQVKGWPVGVATAWEVDCAPKEVILSDRALSGSGTEVKGKHILDPRTGQWAKGHLAAWASHPSAAISDALSTAFMVMSTEEVEALCEKNPEVWALVVPDSMTLKIFNGQLIV